MQGEKIVELVIDALEDMKAIDIKTIDVTDRSSVTDFMIIATGTSRRHVKSAAENVQVVLKDNGLQPKGTEGTDASEWVLVDIGDVVVHVMMPDTREFYDLEKLWHPMGEDGFEQNQDQDNAL
ncbi:MAG: ribosome silencing factor [Pseudomonadales bacterium]